MTESVVIPMVRAKTEKPFLTHRLLILNRLSMAERAAPGAMKAVWKRILTRASYSPTSSLKAARIRPALEITDAPKPHRQWLKDIASGAVCGTFFGGICWLLGLF